MIDPFSLFQPMPSTPPGVPSWVELQMLEAARAQAAWAANQAYWAKFGALTQLAAFIAAGAAAWFTWQAASASREQAEAAQSELSESLGARDAASRLAAWELRSFLNENIVRVVSSGPPSSLPSRMSQIAKARPLERPRNFSHIPWDEIAEEGFRLAIGVNSPSVLPLWVAIVDAGAKLRVWSRLLSLDCSERAKSRHSPHLPPALASWIAMEDDENAKASSLFAPGEAMLSAYWRCVSILKKEADAVARGSDFRFAAQADKAIAALTALMDSSHEFSAGISVAGARDE